MSKRLRVKYSLLLSDFNDLNFFDRFSKKFQISNFTKIRPLGAELFHAEIWTDGNDEANSRVSTQLCERA